MTYKAPQENLKYCLEKIVGIDSLFGKGHFAEVDQDLMVQIINEASKFSEEMLAPYNYEADGQGAKIAEDKEVKCAKSFYPAYQAFVEGGWQSINFPAEHGGMGLPKALGLAVYETIHSSNMAFGLGPMLTTGAIEALIAHGSDELKEEYLEKLMTGEWTGTMNLTEPGAGSDVGALITKAVPFENGSYKIYGQKIFITWGDHDLTDNIIHLVLARLPDAPAGVKGISLFLVPKYLKDANGEYTIRNDAGPISLEHKLGIHASPTCVMGYGDGIWGNETGAIGYLIGKENKGLAAMFTMMNVARLNVGLEGVSVAEAATQKAKSYSLDRKQGRAFNETEAGSSVIAKHPDIKRMLLTMEAKTMAARSICYLNGLMIDEGENATDEQAKKDFKTLEGILTPISKAWSTDVGIEVASLGIQVHGGMGFIEETGAAQYYRDARIAAIYEGTNGIQAMDLIGRKLAFDKGYGFSLVKKMMLDIVANAKADFADKAAQLEEAVATLSSEADRLIDWQTNGKMGEALAGATPFLEMFGDVLGGALLLKGITNLKEATDLSETFKKNQNAICSFYFANILSKAPALAKRIEDGAAGLFDYIIE